MIDYHFFLDWRIAETRSYPNMAAAYIFCEKAGYDEFCDVESYEKYLRDGTWQDWTDLRKGVN